MRNKTGLCVALCGILVGGTISFLLHKKRYSSANKAKKYQIETTELLTLAEIVSYFNSLDLKEDTDIPFLCTSKEFIPFDIPKRDGCFTIIAGCYHKKTNVMTHIKVYFAKHNDESLAGVLKKASANGLVVLK